MARRMVFSPSNFVETVNTSSPVVYSDMAHKQLLLFKHKLPSSAESRAGHVVGFYLSETRLVAYDFTDGSGIGAVAQSTV